MRTLFILITLLFSFRAFAVAELSFEFSYDTTVYGDQRENEELTRSYTISLATYFWKMTALELNFMISDEISDVQTDIDIDNDIVLNGTYTRVENIVYGIGIRQALASKKSFIRPLISIGYARQLVTSKRTLYYEDTASSTSATIHEPSQKLREDSVFLTWIMQLNLSRRISLSGSVKSIFPAFEFDKAKDELIYSLGLTWIF